MILVLSAVMTYLSQSVKDSGTPWIEISLFLKWLFGKTTLLPCATSEPLTEAKLVDMKVI